MIIFKFLLTFFLITFFFQDLETKNYDLKTFICADEVGPRLEFLVPQFDKDLKKEILFKLYSIDNRKSFEFKKGLMEKKLSAIDNSYYFYEVNYSLKKENLMDLLFEFYPPSTLMIQNNENQYSTLACWINN